MRVNTARRLVPSLLVAVEKDSGESVGYAYTESEARLFAAAPDLLTVCEQVLSDFNTIDAEDYDHWRALGLRLQEVVAKAKGGTS